MIHESRDSRSHGPVHQTRRKNCIQGNPRRGQYQSKSIHARINQCHYPNRKFSLQNLWFRDQHSQAVPNPQAVQPLKYDMPKRQAHSYTSSYPLCHPNYRLRFLLQTLTSEQASSQGTTQAECLEVSFSFSFLFLQNNFYPLFSFSDGGHIGEDLTGKDVFTGYDFTINPKPPPFQ